MWALWCAWFLVAPMPSTQLVHICSQIDAFTNDYPSALSRAEALDAAIMGNASNISSNYVDLVSLNSRQVMASLDITVANGTNGQPDPTTAMVFMKDIGTSGYAFIVDCVIRFLM